MSRRRRRFEDKLLLASHDARIYLRKTIRHEEGTQTHEVDGFGSIVDRYASNTVDADRIDLNSINQETMQTWHALYQKWERGPLPVHDMPYHQWQWKYARWDCRSTQVGGRNTAPHRWNCEERKSVGEFDDPDVEAAPGAMVWTGKTSISMPREPPWSSGGSQARYFVLRHTVAKATNKPLRSKTSSSGAFRPCVCVHLSRCVVFARQPSCNAFVHLAALRSDIMLVSVVAGISVPQRAIVGARDARGRSTSAGCCIVVNIVAAGYPKQRIAHALSWRNASCRETTRALRCICNDPSRTCLGRNFRGVTSMRRDILC